MSKWKEAANAAMAVEISQCAEDRALIPHHAKAWERCEISNASLVAAFEAAAREQINDILAWERVEMEEWGA